MAKSAKFHQLCKHLRSLRERLLPAEFDPLGQYSDRKLTRTIAYRVLAHAEIEAFLETRVFEIAQRALSKWKTSQESSRTILALLAFSGKQMSSPPISIDPPQSNQIKEWEEKKFLDKKIHSAAKSFFSNIKLNHGIKEENLLSLLLPIGFPVDKLDPLWVADMNSFGIKRGQAAHQSIITHTPNPKDELTAVVKILCGIEKIDEELNYLL